MILKQVCVLTLLHFVKSEVNRKLLTTQKIFTEYLEQPTTIRRLSVDFTGVSNTLPKTYWLSNIKHGENGRRNFRDTIFIWDHYCRYQVKKGDCHKSIERYYYNVLLNACLNFTYSGCKGNQNNFENIDECNQRCSGSTFAYIKPEDITIVCELQYESGLCLGLLPRYYYDINRKKCVGFTYGGCGGNKNNFKTELECMSYCSS